MMRSSLLVPTVAVLLVVMLSMPALAGADIINPGFENKDQVNTTEPDLEPWTLINKTGDKIRCNETVRTVIPTFEGSCSFKFKGGVGEDSRLSQVVDYGVRGIAQPKVPGDRWVCYGTRAYSNSSATRLRVKVNVTVAGDPLVRKAKYVLNGTAEWSELGCNTATPDNGIALTGAELVDLVKITIINKSASGKTFVDGSYSFILTET